MEEKQIILHVFDVLWKWRKHLFIILLTTGIVSSGIMLTKTDTYKAETIFYPASTSIQKPVFTEAERNINYYGDDHDVDRMLSMGKSLDTKRELIIELGLRSHYGLNNDEKNTQKLFKIFNKSYKVVKTEYDAIKISFQDTDPEYAAKVANHARVKVDDKTQNIIKSAQASVLKNAEKSLEILEREIEQLKNELKIERKKYGVYDTESQSEAFAILESQGKNKVALEKRINKYTEGISLVKSLEDEIEFATENLVKYQSNTYRLKSAMESSISSMHIVQKAEPPISKSGPFRSLYVLGALGIMGISSLLILLFIESFKG